MSNATPEDRHLLIAIPLAGGASTPLLGKCDQLAIFQVDRRDKKVLYESVHQAPPHEPGLLPLRLGQLGVDVVLTGGMGDMARELFEQRGITVVLNVPSKAPTQLVQDYLSGGPQWSNFPPAEAGRDRHDRRASHHRDQ